MVVFPFVCYDQGLKIGFWLSIVGFFLWLVKSIYGCLLYTSFFANGGGEANEGMIKLCRKYSYDKYGAGRSTIITLKDSFHGRTITTLTATGQDVFHQYFFPFTEGFQYAAPNDLKAIKALDDGTVCAVMVELIQGEGGVLPLNQDYVNALQAVSYTHLVSL